MSTTATRPASPGLTGFPGAPRQATSAVLVAHGGRADSTAATGLLKATALRLYPFSLAIHGAGRRQGVVVAQLRYRVVGWNGGDPVLDIEWALEELERRHGPVPTVIVGHSMGGRAALRAASHPNVVGVCALAPWLPPGEPTASVAGRSVVIAHGSRDRMTDPRLSLAWAERAHAVADRLCRFDVADTGHAMLERRGVWHGLARHAALGLLGVEPLTPELDRAFSLPAAKACRLRL